MRKLKILVIDDETLVLDSLKIWLSKKGYEVQTFIEPTVCSIYEKKTDDCSKENRCADIILTDYKMPIMNGIELLQYQSQRGCTLDIRNKAVITGYLDNEIQKVIEDMGCSFFEKPLELSLISDWINERAKHIDLSQPLGSL